MVHFKKHILQLRTSDNLNLSAIVLCPEKPKGLIQINSATAVPKEFYINFAIYLAENNYLCLLFDYRGICQSQPPEGLKNCAYKLTDWAEKDMAAAKDFLRSTYPKLPLFFICHSVGGQLIGMVPKVNEIKGMVAIGTSSGFAGDMPFQSKIKSLFFFEIIRPITHFFFHYSKIKFLGIMEDMPAPVTNTWRKWCQNPDYLFHTSNAQNLENLDQYQALSFPIHVITATDDEICTRKNVKNIWKHFKSSKGIDFQYLTPADYGFQTIGHFNFFRKLSAEKLWPIALNKIEEFHGKQNF